MRQLSIEQIEDRDAAQTTRGDRVYETKNKNGKFVSRCSYASERIGNNE